MKTFLHDIITRAGEISLEYRARLSEVKVLVHLAHPV